MNNEDRVYVFDQRLVRTILDHTKTKQVRTEQCQCLEPRGSVRDTCILTNICQNTFYINIRILLVTYNYYYILGMYAQIYDTNASMVTY